MSSSDHFDIGEWAVAILAGGLATRLRPETDKIPKALLKVAGQPFLAHQLRLLRADGIRKVVLCVGYRGEMIEQEFRDGSQLGVELSYSFDGPELLGTGGAIKKALPLLSKHFLVLYGDSYLPTNYAAPAQAFLASGKLGLMTVFRNEGRWDASNVWFDDGVIKSYNKKQPTSEMRYIDYGLGAFDRAAFTGGPVNNAFDLADVYRDLIAKKELAGHEEKQRFYEIGSREGLAELDAMLRSQQLSATT
jgi:NDP-sugar pyrophosphorylase family protein